MWFVTRHRCLLFDFLLFHITFNNNLTDTAICVMTATWSDANPGTKLDNVALPLRQIRHVSSSQGTFLTLGPPKTLKSLESPSAPLSSDQTQLASRWIRMLCNMPSTSLSIIVPARIGKDLALDAAAEYMCDCHHAFLTKEEDDVGLARSSGNRAMMAMRKALVLQGADCSDFVLLSISLLLSSQVLIGLLILMGIIEGELI